MQKTRFIMVWLLTASSAVFAAGYFDDYAAIRYTDTGKIAADNALGAGSPIFKIEAGILTKYGEYIPSTASEVPIIDTNFASELRQISGQILGTLEAWTSISSYYAENFQRSAETYYLKGVPYVIISAIASSNNGSSTTPDTEALAGAKLTPIIDYILADD